MSPTLCKVSPICTLVHCNLCRTGRLADQCFQIGACTRATGPCWRSGGPPQTQARGDVLSSGMSLYGHRLPIVPALIAAETPIAGMVGGRDRITWCEKVFCKAYTSFATRHDDEKLAWGVRGTEPRACRKTSVSRKSFAKSGMRRSDGADPAGWATDFFHLQMQKM